MSIFRLTLSVVCAGVAAFAIALDYTSPGQRLGQLIPDIGAKAGLVLTVDPAWTEEVVVISATDVDPFDLLTRIADATGLSWTQSQGGYRLGRTANDEASARQELYEYSLAMIQAYTPGTGRRETLSQIVDAFPAQTLASLPVGSRVVYSTQANRYQVGFPSSIRQTVVTHVNAQRQELINRMTQAQSQNQNRPNQRAAEMIERLREPLKKINLVVRRGRFDQFTFELQAIDQRNEQSLTQVQNVSYQPVDEAPDALGDFRLPEGEVRDRLRAFGGRRANYGAFADEFRGALLNPLETDPIALAIGPALLASVPEGVNFVACLPDERLTEIARGLESGGFSAFAAPAALMQSRRDGGWVVLEPRLHSVDWSKRRNRAAFAQIAQTYITDRVLDLDAMAAYAAYVSDDFTPSGWDYVLGRELLGQGFESELRAFSGQNLEGLQIYRALRARLTNAENQSLPIGALSSAWLNALVFNSSTAPVRQSQQQNRRQTERGERTEMLANGLPANGQIQVNRDSDSVVIGRSTDGQQKYVLTERDLASMRASQLNSAVRSPAAQLANTSSEFGMTERITYRFSIVYADGTTVTRSITGTLPANRYGAYDSLPGEMRTRVEQRATQILQRMNRGGNATSREVTGSRRRGDPPPQP